MVIKPSSRRNSLSGLAAVGNWLTAPSSQIKHASHRSRAQLTATLTLAMLLLLMISGLSASLVQQANRFTAIWLQISILTILLAYIFSRTRYFTLGAFLLALGLCLIAYLNIILTAMPVQTALFFFVPLGLVLGSALLSNWAMFLLLGTNAAAMIWVLPAYGIAFNTQNGSNLGLISTLGIVLIILNNFRQNIENRRLEEIQKSNMELMEIHENLEKRVEERTQELNRRSTQLEASTLVARSAAMVRDLNELLDSTVNQISERFGFYQAGIFLADSAEKFIVLQAASSEGGRQLLKRGLKMEIGRQGVVGYAAYHKRPRIVQDVSTDSAYVRIPELPDTRSEVALPLIVRNRIIGVLDIQSEESNAFKFDDVYTLQTMADQVALAIDNTLLIEESRVALQQLETLNSASAANIWKTHMREGARGFTYTPLGVAPVTEMTIPEQAGTEKTITVPLNLRGKVIGAISLKRKMSDPAWAEAEREMAERVASQVALAVENARLLEESQHRAMREQKVNELSNRFSRSLDVDALLQNAIRELHNLPQVAEVAVFINPEKESSKAK